MGVDMTTRYLYNINTITTTLQYQQLLLHIQQHLTTTTISHLALTKKNYFLPLLPQYNHLLINNPPHPQQIAMAAFTLSSCPETLSFGRSGYNKDGDNEDSKLCFGRSGYNKDGDNDEKRCFGRSGYNKDGDDEDQGRSGYN
ncbi:hypothetical protein F4680DRAFT_463464 [Xylaria scruposa]|nr:hypothetical protein F4680DRAFT_463464 [Xylaria scruposa]